MEWDEFKQQYIGDFQPTYGPHLQAFLDEWDGCCLCACDHGCNQWLARNAAKMRYILRAINSKNISGLEELAKEAPEVFASRLHKSLSKRRSKKA